MTAASPLPAHRRLDAIDPVRAGRQSVLVAALNNRLVDGLVLRARVDPASRPAGWIAFDGVHVAPLLVGGGVPALGDAAAAAVALGELEPMIAAIEIIVGRPLLPIAVAEAVPDSAVTLLIEAHADGRVRHRLLLAIEDAATVRPVAELPIDPASIVDIPPMWTATIAGPSLRPARLAGISAGDLLLLGTGAPVARFTPPGRVQALRCRLDVQGGSMTVEQAPEGAMMAPDAGEDRTDAVVPITVEFDGGGLTLAQLATLGAGSVVSVQGAVGGTLPVRLRAADRVVASGELVAVGDGYGVLVTAVTQAAG